MSIKDLLKSIFSRKAEKTGGNTSPAVVDQDPDLTLFEEVEEVAPATSPAKAKKDHWPLIVLGILLVVLGILTIIGIPTIQKAFSPKIAPTRANVPAVVAKARDESQGQAAPTAVPTNVPTKPSVSANVTVGSPTATAVPTVVQTAVPTVAVQPLGTNLRTNVQLVGEQLKSGTLLPDRENKNVTVQKAVNDTGVDAFLMVSMDPGTLTIFDDKGTQVAQHQDKSGFAAMLVFPKGWSAEITTTWNKGDVTTNGSWNVWPEMYVPKPGYSADEFKWVMITYWALQGKSQNFFMEGSDFVDYGPNPAAISPLPTVSASCYVPPSKASGLPLGTNPRNNITIVGEQVRSGGELLPDRNNAGVSIQRSVNDTCVTTILLISVDKNSTVVIKNELGSEVGKITDKEGFTVMLIFPPKWSVEVSTTWNDLNGNWNVWPEMYAPKPGYSADEFKWAAIEYWGLTQLKSVNYWFETKFNNLGPTPKKP